MDKKDLIKYIEKNSEKRNKNLKYDFMPGLLEIIERPSHIAGEVIIWTIFVLFCFFILWASVSKVEVNVNVDGSLEPIEEPKIIKAKTSYEVLKINVEEGQSVKSGEVLIEMECDELNDQKEKIDEEILQKEQYLALYDKLKIGTDIDTISIDEYDKKIKNDIKAIITDYKDKISQVDTYSQMGMNDNALKLKESINSQIESDISDIEDELEDYNSSLEKINEAIDEKNVLAPYDGVVYKIYINKTQMNIEENAPIVSVLKKDYTLQMKCYVKDSDIGDIKMNEKVNIKLSAYPYSDYGTVSGKVSFIAEKADTIEKVGKAVLVKIDINDKSFKKSLMPGMSGKVDIIIGKRRIIDYFIEPITGALNNSIREK